MLRTVFLLLGVATTHGATETVAGVLQFVSGRLTDGSSYDYCTLTTSSQTITYINSDDAKNIHPNSFVELVVQDDDQAAPPNTPAFLIDNRPKRIVAILSQKRAKADQKVSPIGRRSALIVIMNYNDAVSPCIDTCALALMYGASGTLQSMYLENSYGTLTYNTASTAAIPRVVTVRINRSVGDPCATQDLNLISSEGNAAAVALGVNPTGGNYDHFVYYTPAICGIGVAFISEVRAYVNDAAVDTLAHEVGHNFGAGHASLDTNNFPENFEIQFGQQPEVIQEYGDSGSIMGIGGFGIRGFGATHRILFGWVPSSAVVDVTPAACVSTSFTLTSLFFTAASQSGISALRLPRAAGGVYLISYRSRNGDDTSMNYGNEVSIHSFTGGSDNGQLWKYVAAGETEYTKDNRIGLSVISTGGPTASVVLTTDCAPALTCDTAITDNLSIFTNTVTLLGDTGNDATYNFAQTAQRDVTISTCSSASPFNTAVGIFSGATLIASNDNGGAGCPSGTSRLTVTNLAPGNYKFVVSGLAGATGAFTLSVTCGAVVGTASNTATASNTPTSSKTPSSSQTPTQTGTQTQSATQTASSTVTPSKTGTPSQTATSTSTTSQTGTPSQSLTPTATSTSTSSQTNTPTQSSTGSATPSASSTQTVAPSQSPSQTSAPSQSATQTISSTSTSSQTNTPSQSPSQTASATSTPSQTNTPSQSPSQTVSATSTPSQSGTRTQSATQTATSTSTSTQSATQTASATSTSSQTNTPTQSATQTASATSTPSQTNTPTQSATQTASATSTPSQSGTRTQSATQTATSTSTPTQTVTSSQTRTGSAPPTSTPTQSATQTGTSTATQTATSTSSSSRTGTGTLTSTATQTGTPTQTRTGTSTSSSSSTQTASPSSSPTGTVAPSGTPSNSASRNPSNPGTPSQTTTQTGSATKTATRSGTSSRSRTASVTGSITGSRTRSVNPSQSPSISLTPTQSVLEFGRLMMIVRGTCGAALIAPAKAVLAGFVSDVSSITIQCSGNDSLWSAADLKSDLISFQNNDQAAFLTALTPVMGPNLRITFFRVQSIASATPSPH